MGCDNMGDHAIFGYRVTGNQWEHSGEPDHAIVFQGMDKLLKDIEQRLKINPKSLHFGSRGDIIGGDGNRSVTLNVALNGAGRLKKSLEWVAINVMCNKAPRSLL